MSIMATEPTPWTLADGRDMLFFSLPDRVPAPVPDRRRLPDRGEQQSQLRFDRQTGQWVVIAALRQDRTYKPSPDQCPLCPGPSGLASEVPAADYDVVVFFTYLYATTFVGLPVAARLRPTLLHPTAHDEPPLYLDLFDIVFRVPDAVPGIAAVAVAANAGALWLQFGVISPEGAAIAAAGGLDVVMDRCMKVEHTRYLGRMHWLGFNTGEITSSRAHG